jgi:hypothetical protein
MPVRRPAGMKLPSRLKHDHWQRPPEIPPADHPRPDFNPDQEVLSGMVQGKKASAYEERAAIAAAKKKAVDGIYFRVALGSERNMPGWKELDLLVSSRGIYYPFEIDSAFTHRAKQNADVLHDAIVLNALKAEGYVVFPKVIHLSGEQDLATQEAADAKMSEFYAY